MPGFAREEVHVILAAPVTRNAGEQPDQGIRPELIADDG
jgi:hypothetical protein